MADKKISELPLIQTISGSTVVVPMVHDGTTIQIPIERLSLFTSQFSATTASNTFIGNQTVNGNVVITGKLTAQELFTEITSASIIFESGSTIFGNTADDTHIFTGTININGNVVGNAPLDFTSQSLNIATGSYNRLYNVTSSVHFTTASLNTQTGSQDLVNLRISSTTGSINTTTSSFNSVFLGISSVTGAINTTTSSFDSVFLGISSFTGSLNSLTGSYATTGSNTFRANQAITGSLSISAGEFSVTTGSGNATSSLIFDHTQNDGVTLGLRHNDRLSFADHTLNVNVWAGGVYTTFVQNGSTYSILNVEAFDDNKIYLYRDTRLFNKSLVIDNNLTVQRDLVIGTGSLNINNGQLSIITGSGALTSSLSMTHTTVDPITGDATLALRYRNNQVGSENNAWKFVATDNGVQVRYDQYTTSNKMLFSLSSFGSNFDKLLIWRDARLFGTGLTVDDSLLVKGVITGSLLSTNGVVSSSNQLFELNQQTGSQSNLNAQIGIATASLNFATGALNSFTGSVIGQTNTISTFTASVNFTTQSLNTQTGSQESMNTTLSIVTGSMRAEIGGIEAYTASLKSAIIVNGNNVRIIGELTASRIYTEFITSSVLFVTGSNIIGDQSSDKHEFTGSVHINDTLFIKGQAIGLGELNTQTGSQDLVNRRISSTTGSINTTTSSFDSVFLRISSTTGSINATTSSFNSEFGKIGSTTSSIHFTTASLNTQTGSQNTINFNISVVTSSIDSHILKQATQTGSQDIVNFNISVVTSSIDSHILKQATQTGSQDLVNLGISTFTGSLRSEVNGIEAYTASLKGAAIVSSSQQITNYYKFAETASANTKFYGNVTASGNISVGADSFTSPGGADKFIGVYSGQDSSIILQDSVETWEMYMNDDLYFTTGSTNPKNVMSLRRVTGNVEINEGNLVIGKAGKGIDFSITSNSSGTMTSEILNDYEEGTFTPTLGGDSTYTTQFGNYTKIGNKVYFKIILIVNLIGTGDAQNIYGLPFTCDSTAVGYPMYVGAFQDLSSARVFMAGRVGASGTSVAIRSLGAAAVGVNAANVFQNGSTIEVAGFYGV
jgi:hypothetical protein